MDSVSNWAVGTFVVFVLALVFFSFLLAVICLIVSIELAVVMWSPLRGWLQIPEHQAAPPKRRARIAETSLEP